MDRISRAVELAAEKRQSKKRKKPLARSESTEPFEYTKTRRIVVPDEVMRENRLIASKDQQQVIIDAYKLLRTRVLHRMQQNNWRVLGITSPGANVGKTLTAVNLAISIAMKHENTVVLVDADLRRPSVHKCLGIEPEYGLLDYLEGNVSIDRMLINPGIDGFVVIPSHNDSHTRSSERLSSTRMERLVRELKARYPDRVVLFDLPPMLVGDDVEAFSPYVDAFLLVVEEGKTDIQEYAKTIEILENKEILGTVLNKSEEVGHGYDYYY